MCQKMCPWAEIFRCSAACFEKNRSASASETDRYRVSKKSFDDLRLYRQSDCYSLTKGMLMQRGPPRPRESSPLGILSTSIPSASISSLVT